MWDVRNWMVWGGSQDRKWCLVQYAGAVWDVVEIWILRAMAWLRTTSCCQKTSHDAFGLPRGQNNTRNARALWSLRSYANERLKGCSWFINYTVPASFSQGGNAAVDIQIIYKFGSSRTTRSLLNVRYELDPKIWKFMDEFLDSIVLIYAIRPRKSVRGWTTFLQFRNEQSILGDLITCQMDWKMQSSLFSW